jgi:peptide chain release factor subunit 1
MINRDLIERLIKMRTPDGVLTATIKLDPRLSYDRSQAAAKFKSAYSRAARRAEATELSVLRREHDRVLEYLRRFEPDGRGIIIYSSEPAGIWEVVFLDITVPTYVTAGATPDTTVLANIIDEYPRMAVVMLDGGDARIYSAEQGDERMTSSHQTELPGRHSQGGWAQARYERHVELHHSKHLKEVADALEATYYERPFDRLVLVGVEEATNELESMLNEPLRRRIIGHLSADFKQDTDSEILERARKKREEDERVAEVALIDRIRGLTEAEGKGALGIDETIMALVEGRVDTLVVAEGITQAGTTCLNCNYFAAFKFDLCPACASTDVETLPDAIEYAIEFAITHGSKVNVAHEGGREMLLSRGGMGAVLRYAVAASDA